MLLASLSVVRVQSGEETFFKVKPNTKMEKIFSAYAQRKGVPPNALRFLLDGTRISGDQTPKMVRPAVGTDCLRLLIVQPVD